MSLKRITADAEGGPGYALLKLDRDPGLDNLEISVFNVYRGEYLVQTTSGTLNWLKQPHYFGAHRVDTESSTFRIGPEVCNYVPPDTVVEIASPDRTIIPPEQINWEGVPVLEEKGGGVLLRDLPG